MNYTIKFDGVYLTEYMNSEDGNFLIQEFENYFNGEENDLNYYLFNESAADLDILDEEGESVYFTAEVPNEIWNQAEQMVFDFYKSGAWKV
jgi:hypothetical protein